MNTVQTETNKQNAGTKRADGKTKVRNLALIAMLAAVSAVLMLLEIPLPFLAPPFYQLDFSEVPVLIGTFAMGPAAGVTIEFVKILLNFVLNGTITAGVGEIGNFLIGCSFIVPAGIIYKQKKTKKHAVIGMTVGTIFMAVAGCFINAYLLLPAYSSGLSIPMDALVGMGTAINPAIDNVLTFVVFAVGPFNVVKGAVVSVLTLLLYKRVSVLIKAHH